ncbi:MAG: DUF2142 domain-containing protein [Propionibacteriaceae bacterium]|nr:DUF2142 domain-containing protein [Propionibacteriaceae bacterium]
MKLGPQGLKAILVRRGKALLMGVSLLGWLLVGYAWVVSSPIGAAPDDDYHQASIWCPTPVAGHCDIVGVDADGKEEAAVPQPIGASVCYAFHPDQSAACVEGYDDTALVGTSRLDTGEYPGYYYDIMHAFVSSDSNRSVLVMRWVNLALALVLLGGLWWALPSASRRLTVYTVLGTAIPLVLYLVTSLNPSSWAIVGVLVAALGLHGWFVGQSPPRRRVALGLGWAGALMAAAARSDAGAYLVLVALALSLVHWNDWRPRLRRLTSALVVAVIGLAGFFSGSQSSALDGIYPTTGRSPINVLVTNVVNFPQLLGGFWGLERGLGWFDVPMPPLTYFAAMAVTIGLVMIGLARTSWSKTLALVLVWGAVVGLPLFVLQRGLNYFDEGVQIRYVAPLIVVGVALALMRRDARGADALSVAQSLVCYLALVVAHAAALHSLIRRYVTGVDLPAFDLDTAVEWWRAGGPGPMLTWSLGSVGFALVGLALFAVRPARTRRLAAAAEAGDASARRLGGGRPQADQVDDGSDAGSDDQGGDRPGGQIEGAEQNSHRHQHSHHPAAEVSPVESA